VHAGEEDYARPGWTTSKRGQDSPWKSQAVRQRTEINGENRSTVWPILGSRTSKEQNRTVTATVTSVQWVRLPAWGFHSAVSTLSRLVTETDSETDIAP